MATVYDPAQIPRALRVTPQWVCWRFEVRDGKRTKVPYNASTGARAESDNEATWSSFEKALEFHRANDWTDGIGLVVSDEDDFVGLDLDYCRDPETGEIAEWAQKIVTEIDSYTEITPSNAGLRIFARGSLPVLGRKKGNFEIYETGRYLTVTGNHLEGTPLNVAKRELEIRRVHRSIWPDPQAEPDRPRQTPGPVNLVDAELLAKARIAANGQKFSLLWSGSSAGYGSRSEADLALCSLLAFWTGGDSGRVDALFRSSGLFRPKWDQRHFSDGGTYGQHTVDKAINGTTTYYTPPAIRAPFSIESLNGTAHHDDDDPHETPFSSFPMTDMGNAQRLVALFGQGIRYCHVWGKWLVWDGRRWNVDDTGGIVRCAKETARAIREEATDCEDDAQAKKIMAWALKSEAEARIKSMIALAQSEPGIPVTPDHLDANPWLLCVSNGVIDLKTGEIREHRRDDLITRWTPVEYDQRAECPKWLAFLDQIMDGKASLVEFLQRITGYSLTGVTGERALFFLYGMGANGKSTFLETVKAMLGDYAMRTPTETLLAKQEGAIPNDVARLKGARFVSASEAEEGKRLAESLVKSLTGGDTISARFMRGEWFDFKPEFKLWLATNHKPIIRGTDRGIWDRIRLIPFEVRIPDEQQDKELPTKLLDELKGVLAWAMQGCLDWQRDGLMMPEEVREAVDAYRSEMDILAAFLEDRCLVQRSEKVGAKELFESYKGWCEGSGERPMTQRALGTRLKERGFESRRAGTHGGYVWFGIGLSDGRERQEGFGE